MKKCSKILYWVMPKEELEKLGLTRDCQEPQIEGSEHCALHDEQAKYWAANPYVSDVCGCGAVQKDGGKWERCRCSDDWSLGSDGELHHKEG